jgi:hypothetical protein
VVHRNAPLTETGRLSPGSLHAMGWSSCPRGDSYRRPLGSCQGREDDRADGALAQSYGLLRAVLNVAVADEVIPLNPCRFRGAGTPKATRPSRALTAVEALQLAEQLERDRRTGRYRALAGVRRPGVNSRGAENTC